MTSYCRAALHRGINRIRRAAGADPLPEGLSATGELKQAGQIIVIFALMLTVFIGLVGIAIDSTYAWRESLRVQRAADAASLAGVVYLPGCFNSGSGSTCTTYNATDIAKAEAKKNGFASTVTPMVGATPRELDVKITTQVPTFFSRIFGINSWTVSRLSKAVYVTPVPMGSPQGWYGVYQLCDANHSTPTCTAETSPTGVTVSSQGFFGAIEGEGSQTSTGDAFAPYWNPKRTVVNSRYDSGGYEYDITAKTSGTVYLYDPMFCATSTKQDGSGHAGAGDHWLGTPTPVSTYYIMYDTENTPLTRADDVKVADFWKYLRKPELRRQERAVRRCLRDESVQLLGQRERRPFGRDRLRDERGPQQVGLIRDRHGRPYLSLDGHHDRPGQPHRQQNPGLREHVLYRSERQRQHG